MTIIEFLEARIAEDEIQAAKHLPALSSHGLGDYGLRVLAECAAKRAVIAEHELAERSNGISTLLGCVLCNYNRDYGWEEDGPCKTLRAVATVYKDHPDYQQEWALDTPSEELTHTG